MGNGQTLYRETIPFPGFSWLVALMTGLALVFLGFTVYSFIFPEQAVSGAPFWFYLLMFAVFTALSFVIFNFRVLSVVIDSRGIDVNYGLYRHFEPWSNITTVRVDLNPGFKYGGWGIRIGRYRGKWVLVYNVINTPLVELELEQGKYSMFAFSSGNITDITGAIEDRIK